MKFENGEASLKCMKIIETERKFSVLLRMMTPSLKKIPKTLLSIFIKEIQVVENRKEVVDLYHSRALFDTILINQWRSQNLT